MYNTLLRTKYCEDISTLISSYISYDYDTTFVTDIDKLIGLEDYYDIYTLGYVNIVASFYDNGLTTGDIHYYLTNAFMRNTTFTCITDSLCNYAMSPDGTMFELNNFKEQLLDFFFKECK